MRMDGEEENIKSVVSILFIEEYRVTFQGENKLFMARPISFYSCRLPQNLKTSLLICRLICLLAYLLQYSTFCRAKCLTLFSTKFFSNKFKGEIHCSIKCLHRIFRPIKWKFCSIQWKEKFSLMKFKVRFTIQSFKNIWRSSLSLSISTVLYSRLLKQIIEIISSKNEHSSGINSKLRFRYAKLIFIL